VLPTLCALYRAGLDPQRLSGDDQTMRLMLRSIRESYRVLVANGIPITPANHRVFDWLPEWVLMWIMRRMLRAESTAIKVGHASGARGEGRLLAQEFRALIQQTDVATPATDTLHRELEAEPVVAASERRTSEVA